MNGFNIVLDVNSGAVHLFDDLSYDIIGQIEPPLDFQCPGHVIDGLKEKYDTQAIKESYNELYNLYKANMLFSSDDYAEIAKTVKQDAPVKALCLHVAHDCNMRCSYCFASTGDFNQHKRTLMSEEVARKAIDFVLEKSADRQNIEIDFFGGEPLMNFDVVKKTVDYARSKEKKHHKNFRFTITTNGILLNDEIQEYVNQNMHNVVISLDGRKPVNDRMRKTVSGEGSYDIILPKFQKLAKSRGQDQYYIRGTFTKYNLDFASDVMHFFDKGFEQISIEPVVTESNQPYAIGEEDLEKIYNEYEKLAKWIIGIRQNGEFVNFFHFMIDLNQGPCVIKRLRGCGAGNEYLAVTPDGDIYPCHQFVGMDDFKMGSVFNGELDWSIKQKFIDLNVYAKEDCKNCWAKFYCSGGCIANAYKYGGGLKIPHKLSCEMTRKRLECAIMIQAALS